LALTGAAEILGLLVNRGCKRKGRRYDLFLALFGDAMKIRFKLLRKAERQLKLYNPKLLVFIILAWLTNAILAFIALSFGKGDEGTSIFAIICSFSIAALTGFALFRQRSQVVGGAPKQRPDALEIHLFSIADVLLWLAAVGGGVEIVVEFLRLTS
jgi:hypothetical protein